jgi:hypothetical protein
VLFRSDAFAGFEQLLPSGIRTAIIHNHDFVGDAAEPQFQMQMLYGGRNAALFIPGGNYDAQEM